ncbi:MAG TPA: hypothetical protein VGM63_10260 [Mucilaginibacter sp.]
MTNNTPATPTLFDWAGGMPVFEQLFDQFYDKVLADEILEPVFRHMSPSIVCMGHILWPRCWAVPNYTASRKEAIFR